MLFEIINGLPYLISHGKAYPVEIKDGTVKYDAEHATATRHKGRYTLIEIVAKCGKEASSVPAPRKTKRRTGDE